MTSSTSVAKPMHLTSSIALLLVFLLTIFAGCAVTLISRYDEQLDRSATVLQQKMDAFLTSLESSPQPTYDQKQSFYSDYAVELRSVLVRAQSHPKNGLTEKQLRLMIDNLGELRKIHEAGPVGPETIVTIRELFNQAWGAIIKLELAKKRG